MHGEDLWANPGIGVHKYAWRGFIELVFKHGLDCKDKTVRC